MKLGVVPAGITLFFGLLALSGCHVVFGISGAGLRETVQAKVDATVTAMLTAYPTPNVAGTVKAAVEATQTAGPVGHRPHDGPRLEGHSVAQSERLRRVCVA
jgi:hypothetical protein